MHLWIFLKKAAINENSIALYKIGVYYEIGIVVEKNISIVSPMSVEHRV